MEYIINGNLYETWRKPEHIFRKFHSFGISLDNLMYAKGKGATRVLIHFTKSDGTTKDLISDIAQWFDSPLEYVNRGDIQKHVKIDDMKVAIKFVASADDSSTQ